MIGSLRSFHTGNPLILKARKNETQEVLGNSTGFYAPWEEDLHEQIAVSCT
jgi:hypothetical protein